MQVIIKLDVSDAFSPKDIDEAEDHAAEMARAILAAIRIVESPPINHIIRAGKHIVDVWDADWEIEDAEIAAPKTAHDAACEKSDVECSERGMDAVLDAFKPLAQWAEQRKARGI